MKQLFHFVDREEHMKQTYTTNPFMPLSITQHSIDKHASQTGSNALSGMRLAVKDLFHMAGLPTSAGNPTWLDTHDIPTTTAFCVTQLLDHGAEFVGKTITDELAYSLNGQNIHYGTPYNPITPERLPGGSSSGSAVAVAANLADIGLGTDTGGSIRVPASYQGLFGLRPTHGTIAVEGLVALAPSFDTVGWLTRELSQLELVGEVLLPDTQLPDAQLPNTSSPQPFTHILLAENLLNACEQAEQIRTLLDVNKSTLTDIKTIHMDYEHWQLSELFRLQQGWEIQQQHGEWLSTANPTISPDIQARFDWCKCITQSQYQQAVTKTQAFCQWLLPQLEKAILVIPTTPGRAPLLTTSEADLADYRLQLMNLTAIAGLAGLPQLHLPVCDIDGAPCGLSLIGPRHSDKHLIQLAGQWFPHLAASSRQKTEQKRQQQP
ncbi:amidase [Marinomonas agarivorans]|nr:amidase [Marinomonas agarivorans]